MAHRSQMKWQVHVTELQSTQAVEHELNGKPTLTKLYIASCLSHNSLLSLLYIYFVWTGHGRSVQVAIPGATSKKSIIPKRSLEIVRTFYFLAQTTTIILYDDLNIIL